RIHLPAAPGAPRAGATTETPEVAPEAIAAQPPFEIIDRLFQHYQTMTFTRAPYIQTEFDLYPGRPASNTLDFRMEVPEARTADYRIAGLQARLRLRQSRLHGELAVREAESMDLPVRDFSTHFAVTPDALIVHDARAICGEGPQMGSILMHAAYNFSRDTINGEIRTDMAPATFLPLLRNLEFNHLAAALADFDFPDRPPFVNGTFHGRLRNRPGLWLAGTAGADDLLYEQVPVAAVETAFTAGFCATNAVLDFHPMIVTRRDGVLQGRLLLDFMRKFVGFNALSGSDPHAVAQMIHPVVARAVAPFTFNGPAQARAAGVVGFSGQIGDAVELSMECRQAGWHFLIADFCRMNLQVTDENIELTDITGDIFGGHFNGEVILHRQDSSPEYFYEAQAQFAEVDFQELMRACDARRPETYRGRMRLQMQLAGPVDQQADLGTIGRGRITISDGRIFQIPLFGGLSDMLARLLPGMGLIMRQTDLQADFTVKDGRISSDAIRIEGDVLSLRASGHCLMDGRLDFRVQITMLRQHTLAATIMRLATFPVSKILEFHLTGTLENPQWKMTYLPRDLFTLFSTQEDDHP
ncbi:MAG: AsmA-like C-terminal region-containing protein, partial [Lentisphaerae bacterium]|nr:AsmA-like C-terminal region-containing protein [Lentisphaerota bacterium]